MKTSNIITEAYAWTGKWGTSFWSGLQSGGKVLKWTKKWGQAFDVDQKVDGVGALSKLASKA